MSDPFKHPECLKCIADRTAKYGANMAKLECSGIKADVTEDIDFSPYPVAEREQMRNAFRTLLDPILWGSSEFGLEIRDYQDLMVKCTATRKMSRTGRRVGKTHAMALHMLHKAFTTERFKILVIAPVELQIKEIFDLFDLWATLSPNFRDSIDKRINNPFTLKLKNGSRIMGLTAGTKAGQGAMTVRGQEADALYLDEADYLAPDDIGTLFVLLQQTKAGERDAKYLWASSTPTGKHQHFYEWSHNPRFKEFHYPSWVNPMWTVKMEEEFREIYGQGLQWDHEVAAEWGEEMEGVYAHQYIDRAIQLSEMFLGNNGMWDYNKQEPKAGCVYTMGVDWNTSRNGVQIVICEYDTTLVTNEDLEAGMKGRVRIATRVSIDAKEFTQSKAVEKIIELNYTWQPKAIYVDQGYGSTQIEDLRRWGNANPESQMLARLKPIDFSTTQEVHDPVTKQINKKPMKPFMVGNAVTFFEKNVILLNRADKDFEKQLRDYTVARRSRDGRPVYSEGNDHVLDAFNLCMLAFTLEFTDLGRPIYTATVRMAGKWGERPPGPDEAMDTPEYMGKIQTKGKRNSPITQPRDIPLNAMDYAKNMRFWQRGTYKSNKMNRPLKRDIPY